MCQFGAVIQPDDASPSACAAAIADLNLDLAVITFQYATSPSWSEYSTFYNAIPPGQIMALIQTQAGANWPNVSPDELASFAAEVKQRYPGIGYYEIINEPDVTSSYPPSGIDPTTYFTYYKAVKNAILNNPRVIPHGPNTSQWISTYNPDDGRQYFHGYGASPPYIRRYYWMTEWQPPFKNGLPDPITCWQMNMGYGAAIFYLLQDSPASGSPDQGILDINGNPKQPLYDQAKEWLFSPTPA